MNIDWEKILPANIKNSKENLKQELHRAIDKYERAKGSLEKRLLEIKNTYNFAYQCNSYGSDFDSYDDINLQNGNKIAFYFDNKDDAEEFADGCGYSKDKVINSEPSVYELLVLFI